MLSTLVDMALPENKIPRVYANTGIELNMIRDFVIGLQKHDDRIIILKPKVPIKQMLVAPAGTELSSIRKIYSHEKALEQCKKLLSTMPECKLIPYSTTSAAAAAVAALNDKCSAAIASETAARLNRLEIIKDSIQDEEDNYTEFVVFRSKK